MGQRDDGAELDLDPVEDFDAALNISIDDKYKEVEQTVDTGERPPR